MEELRQRIKDLMHEIEYKHLKKDWVEKLITLGIEDKDAYKWSTEIGHIVDEYERSLRLLTELFEIPKVGEIVEKLESRIAYTNDITVWKIGDAIEQMKGRHEKYLPPDDEDDEI